MDKDADSWCIVRCIFFFFFYLICHKVWCLDPFYSTLPIAHRIRSHGLHMHCYTDDSQLYLASHNPNNADAVHNDCIKVERSLADINACMTNNKLKLNNDMTEIMLFGTRSSLADVNITSIEVAGTHVHVSDGPVRSLGDLLDNSLSPCLPRWTGWYNQHAYIWETNSNKFETNSPKVTPNR